MSLLWSGILGHAEGCAGLVPPLNWASWETWAWRHESRRADPTPRQLPSTWERSLYTFQELLGSWAPKDASMGELALLVVSCVVL